jgi:hypothetical protein
VDKLVDNLQEWGFYAVATGMSKKGAARQNFKKLASLCGRFFCTFRKTTHNKKCIYGVQFDYERLL